MRHKASFAIVFLVRLILFLTPAQAQTDSLSLKPRSFSQQAITQTIRNDKAFRYDNGPLITPPGAWERFWQRVWDTWNDLLNRRGVGTAMQYGLLLLALAVIVFAVIKLIGMQGFFFIAQKPKEAPLGHGELSANIHEISFDERIRECIGRRQYRPAVRLLYLQTLKQLSDRALIHWQKEKTNAEYSRELENPLRAPFSKLTREFEYVWYGGFPLGEGQFFTLKNSFADFADGLKKHA